MKNLKEKLFNVVEKMTTERHIVAIKNGMMAYVPFTIVGAVAMLIAAFPADAYQNFMTGVFGEGWAGQLYGLNNGMMNLGGIICLLFISFELSRQFEDINVNPIYPTVISFGVYVYLTKFVSSDAGNALAISDMGVGNLIGAIIIAMSVPELFRFLVKKKLTIKLPSSVPPMVTESFVTVIPLGVIITLAFIIGKLIALTPYADIHQLINAIIGAPLKGLVGSAPGFIILNALSFLLWGFGVHGTNILISGLARPFLLMLSEENRLAFQAGLPLPNIITNEFMNFFLNFRLCLAIACILVAKNKGIKEVAKAGIVPALFTIHEPLVFGLPICFNPYFVAADIIGPTFGATLTYIAMSIGLIPKLTGVTIAWTTPIFLSGYLMTNSIKGTLWQLFLNVCYIFIAIPFVKMYDRQKLREEEMKKDDE